MAHILSKSVVIAMASMMLFSSGCSSDESEISNDVENKDTVEEQQHTDETAKSTQSFAEEVIWVSEPRFAFTGIKEFSPYIEFSATGVRRELIGYPDEWEKNAGGVGLINYTSDTIEVMQGNKSGVFDYSGNELYPVTIKKPVLHSRFDDSSAIVFEYLHYVINGDGDKAFSNNFRSIGNYNASTEYSALIMEQLRYREGKLENYSFLDETYSEGTYPFDAYGIVREFDNNNIEIGRVIFDNNGNYVADVQGDHLDEAWIVNKMLIVQRNGKYAFQSAVSGELITDFVYDSVKEFMDGYAPAKKNGKWGYINTEGTEVTDFIFDDASRLYKGNVYVSVDGVYGVLNLIENLDSGNIISAETCKADPDVVMKVAEQKDSMMIPIGHATVLVDNLNVRLEPSTGSDLAAEKHSIKNGQSFDVYAIDQNEGYTWYQIDDEMWIANDGTWVDYIELE